METSNKSLKTREIMQGSGEDTIHMMIPEEEYPPSKSVTDTSQKQESKAVNNNISDMDLLREFEKQDPDDAKRRT